MGGQVVGRLAPSPNGALHLGHALSFLAAWWSARSKGGSVILRMEDVDADRVGAEHIERALVDLTWLGLDWDGSIRVQSQRPEPAARAAERLLAEERAYPCVCSRKDLLLAQSQDESRGAPQMGVSEGRYPGTCRHVGYASVDEAEKRTQKEAGLRFIVPEGPVLFQDGVYGEQSFDVAKDVGDFLIVRRNKKPSYQLCVVVDDHEDGVTEVVRGRDLLPSTARQKLLSDALGLDRPATYHVPLVCDHTGVRISKRNEALGIGELRAAGVAPEKIITWVRSALGFAPAEAGLARQGIAGFEISRITTDDIILPLDPMELFR